MPRTFVDHDTSLTQEKYLHISKIVGDSEILATWFFENHLKNAAPENDRVKPLGQLRGMMFTVAGLWHVGRIPLRQSAILLL